jgi:hypothetical protein
MKQNTSFKIDGIEKVFSTEKSPEFKFGSDQILSNKDTDVSFGQPWYEEGYSEINFLNSEEFKSLKDGLISSIGNIIKNEIPSINLTGFNLENYHSYINNDSDHLKVVTKTRDLFPEDFHFPVEKYIQKLENILNFSLTDIDPFDNKKLHIIVRINRPFSRDYNPPHKDIYDCLDNLGYIPQFVNFWIPIAGVTEKSNLPVAPKSHTINEELILRTFEGGQIEGNKYRVIMIKNWGGDNSLIRSKVKYGQVLVFSSHLIHGLALNEEADKTRVALEFRLFKK